MKSYVIWCAAVVSATLLGLWVANREAPNLLAGGWVVLSIFAAPFFYDWAYNAGKTADSWTHIKVPLRDGLNVSYFKERAAIWICPFCLSRSVLRVLCDPTTNEDSRGNLAQCSACEKWSHVKISMEPEVVSVTKESA